MSMNKFLLLSLLFSAPCFGASEYEIQKTVNDETFIINGNVFKAKTYCFNVNDGDRVIFIKGSAYGSCASASFVNLRSKKVCEVWCE